MKESRSIIVEPDPIQRERLVSRLAMSGATKPVGSYSSITELIRNPSIRNRTVDLLIINADANEAGKADFWAIIAVALPETVALLALTAGHDDRVLKNLVAHSRTVQGVQWLHNSPGEISRAVIRICAGLRGDDQALLEKMKRSLMNLVDGRSRIMIGDLEVDTASRTLSRAGQSVQLTELEARVLGYLAGRSGEPVSPYELLEMVWGNSIGEGGTLDQVRSCIWRLRRKIEPRPRQPRYLVQIRGKGYLLNMVPARSAPAQH